MMQSILGLQHSQLGVVLCNKLTIPNKIQYNAVECASPVRGLELLSTLF